MKTFKKIVLAASIVAATLGSLNSAEACTGISLKAKDGSYVIGRTMEWGGFRMPSRVVIVPRGYSRLALTPEGKNGMELKAKYGYAGIGVLDGNFIAEGMNEKGVVVELFYFPGYGETMPYKPENHGRTLCDAQFLDWVLCNFATIGEMEAALGSIDFCTFGDGFESAHYRIADATGRDVVVEFYDQHWHVWENNVGVITNSPSFDWHVTNLNNYVNVFPGGIEPRQLNDNLKIRAFGVGSAAHGLPGDLTPPSRFVRAAFYVNTAKKMADGWSTVKQVFQILNNFDIPIGMEFGQDEMPDLVSATQWTSAIDIAARKLYYKTEWNASIRCLDFNEINFGKVKLQTLPLDKVEDFPVEKVRIR